jgi:hypothetical protein
MLDQNVTTLLSTLLGGLLAITGGLIATFYASNKQLKQKKREDYRHSLEIVYRNLFFIEQTIKRFAINDVDFSTEYNNLLTHISETALTINLYLPEIREIFSRYSKEMSGVVEIMFEYMNDSIDYGKYTDYTRAYQIVDCELKGAIEDMIAKKRFSHF